MNAKRILQIISAVSGFGMLFSGALTWREFTRAPDATWPSCTPLGTPGTLLGYPPCVYGLVMYAVIFGLSILAMQRLHRGVVM